MAKSDPSELVDAAAAFNTELTSYARFGKLFLETPLTSVKHLERANQTLREIASCEERLQAAGQRLVKALATARDHQEQLAKDVVAHVPAIQARNQRLQDLMTELNAVAAEVSNLNTVISTHRGNGDSSRPPTAEEAHSLSTTILALSERAEKLASVSQEAEFEELATQAHSLHQRLNAIGKKLGAV